MTEKDLKLEFDRVRRAFPNKRKRSLETEWQRFIKKHKDWRDVVPVLYDALMYQIEDYEIDKKAGKWVPEWCMFQTWIHQRRWEWSLEDESQAASQYAAEMIDP